MKLLLLITMALNWSHEESTTLSVSSVLDEIQKQEILYPCIVIKQAILETGWFKSYSATERNNIFGFWDSAANNWMKFDTWQSCVSYYKRWQVKLYKGGDYYDFLDKIGYASDENYIRKLQTIKITI